MVNQDHEKKNSASLAIREMEIKNTMRCHLAPTKMAITIKIANNGAFLVVQWLRLCAPSAGALGSITG